jgi:hypothetical protein
VPEVNYSHLALPSSVSPRKKGILYLETSSSLGQVSRWIPRFHPQKASLSDGCVPCHGSFAFPLLHGVQAGLCCIGIQCGCNKAGAA